MVQMRYCLFLLLFVLELPSLTKAAAPHSNLPNPRIVEHPQDGYLSRNNPETLDCRAEGDPKPVITWYRNGERVITYPEDPKSHRLIIENRKLFFLSVIHTKKDKPDVGVYYCNATNSHGSALSRNATLKIAILKDDFRLSPTDDSAAVGDTVTFHCRPPRGEPEPTILWMKGGEHIQKGGSNNRFQIQPNGDLVISATRKRDAGTYKCIASNKAGERQSSPATLKVLEKPSFRRYPNDLTTQEGKNVEFPCDVIGDQPLNVEWKKEGGRIKFGRMRMLPDHSLRIESVGSGDSGTYICVARNAVGTTEAVATLTVEFQPVFIIKPEDKRVGVGRTVYFPCAVMANPSPNIYWNKKSSLSTTNKEGLMFPNFEKGRLSVSSDGTLKIARVEMKDAGEYMCEGINTLGIITATVRLDIIKTDPRPPPIIRIGPQKQILPTKESALLSCEAIGLPLPRVQWFKDGYPVNNGDRIVKLSTGTLQISDLRESDSGMYTCKATSETGETTWGAMLQVEEPSPHQSIEFVRSPDVPSFPGAPSRPTVSDITSNSAHLEWQQNNNHGDSPVYAYVVEFFSYETVEGWELASDSVQRESYTVKGLQPDTAYVFIIRAKNSHGVGTPSEISHVIRTKASNESPTRLQPQIPEIELRNRFSGIVVQMDTIETINSSAIHVTWEVLKEQEHIDRFEIRYTELLDIQTSKRGKKFAQFVGRNGKSHTLTHLRSNMWYEVCVRAFSGDIPTQCTSPQLKVKTDESKPDAAPQNIIIQKESDSSIHIQWLPPSREHRNGEIRGYMVTCMSSDNKHNCSLSTNGSTNHVTIKRLDPDMTYNIKVAARTRKGVGVFSKAFIVGPEQPSIMKEPWFIGMLIGTIGGTLWLALCIFSIWLCRKRKNKKKMMQSGMYSVPTMHKPEDTRTCNSFYRNGYGQKDVHACQGMGSMSPEVSNLLDKDLEMQDQNIYNIPQMKTFYHKKDPVAPYATTTLINAGNMTTSRQNSGGMDHMFRPINQNSGSGDSCCKQEHVGSSDSNTDNSRPNTGIPHEHNDPMQSPTSDSGSHTTDENGLLIKRGKKSQKIVQPKQAMVNWAEFLPPPPEHPPPGEMMNLTDSANNMDYAEVNSERGMTRSPLSPVSKISSCSCPPPHGGNPMQTWNVPAYSDSGCARCSSPPKYCESWHYNPQTYSIIQQRTQSPRGTDTWGQRTIACMHPSRGTPVDMKCVNRTCHSDQEQGPLPSLSNYKIIQAPREGECMCMSDGEKSSHYSCVRPCMVGSQQDGSCIDRACQSSLPSVASECIHSSMYPARLEMSDSGQHLSIAMEGYRHPPESPTSDLGGPEYVGESDTENQHNGTGPGYDSPSGEGQCLEDGSHVSGSMLASWASVTDQSNTDCSSLRSSAASSSDGSFLTEADFASAVAKAAEMSGLTVVGTTVCDPKTGKPVKKQRRHHRHNRPTSPYSTDSNFSAVVHKPYPKSQRKKQLIQQGKWSNNRKQEHSPIPEQKQSSSAHEDIPSYNKPSFPSPAPAKSRYGKKTFSPSSPSQNGGINFGILVKESNVPVV